MTYFTNLVFLKYFVLKTSYKDNAKRYLINNQEISYTVHDIIKLFSKSIQSKKLIQYLRYLSTKTFQNAPRNSYTKTKSICILTGRSRSVYRFFRVSRLKIREYANAGYFVGITKSSW